MGAGSGRSPLGHSTQGPLHTEYHRFPLTGSFSVFAEPLTRVEVQHPSTPKIVSPKYNQIEKMRGSDSPPRTSATPAPIPAGRHVSAWMDGNLDPLEQPINRGPRFGRHDSLDTNSLDDPEPATDPLSDDGEIVDSAQPQGEDGVTDDMSTMALNPTHLKPGDLERLAESEVTPATLHLNGDFAQMDDAAIMLELKAGNMAGFDFLIQKYRKPIINFMYRMTRNQAVAEELAQEVFLRVYRSRETYRAEARFSTWLYRIATNLGVNQARDTRHERAASIVYLDEADSETGTTPDVADSTP